MVKRILLIATTTGYQTEMFTAAAARLNYHVTLATDRCHVLDDPWADQAIPLRFEDPQTSAERLPEQLAFDGVVALGDRPALAAAYAAQRLGLKFSPPHALETCGNKYLARQRFKAAGLPVPEFLQLSLDEDPDGAARSAHFPCVLKPLGLSASRGVIRADNPAEFVAAFRRIEKLLRSAELARLGTENRFIQVERFISGREFALEGLVTNGRLKVLAIFDKPDPLDGPFFEETIYVTPSRESGERQCEIARATQSAVDALGLTDGPMHAEMRVNDQGVWILEVAGRPIGGLCARVLPGLPELILRHAAGDALEFEAGTEAAGVMMIPVPAEGVYQSVSGLEAACATPLIEDAVITAKQGQKLLPLPEGNSYVGFLFARGPNPHDVESALRTAHAHLDFHILPALPLL